MREEPDGAALTCETIADDAAGESALRKVDRKIEKARANGPISETRDALRDFTDRLSHECVP